MDTDSPPFTVEYRPENPHFPWHVVRGGVPYSVCVSRRIAEAERGRYARGGRQARTPDEAAVLADAYGRGER